MSGWPDDENVLNRLRQWLEEAHAEADADGADGTPLDGPTELRSVGLFQMIEEFTALRHELKLYTKGARNLEEQTLDTRNAMQAAIEQFRSVEVKEREAAHTAAKPLLEALLELHDALERGRAVIETARRRILEQSPKQLQDELDARFRKQSWWRRWIGRAFHEAVRDACARHTAEVHQAIFESLVDGYRLIQGRLQKAMDKEGILRVPCVGQPVDPNCMTVVEVVKDPSRPPGLVIEEVRPGYYWKSRVFRFAEVRAVQGRPPGGDS
jgi:molecular chaperone GrpE